MRGRFRVAASAAAVIIGAVAVVGTPAAHAADNAAAGYSFNSAPAVGTGTYKQSTVAGEYLFWRVDVRRGQRLSLKAAMTVPADFPIDNGTTRFVMTVYNPLRLSTNCPELNGELMNTPGKRLELDCGPWTVADGKKYETASGEDEGDFAKYKDDDYETPGAYYVQIGLSSQKEIQKGLVLPIELTVAVDGTAQPDPAQDFDFGAPTAPIAPGPAGAAPGGTAPGRTTPVAAADDDASPLIPIGSGAAALAVAAIGAYALGSRRRPSTPAAPNPWAAPARATHPTMPPRP